MQCSVGNGLDRSGTLSYMAQRDLWQSLSGGQRALRPQARFGGQPPQATFGPEMAAPPRNCQQMRNIFLRPSGLDRERRPPTNGAVYIMNVTCAIGQGFRRGRVTPPYRAFDVCGKTYTFLQNPRDVGLTPIW